MTHPDGVTRDVEVIFVPEIHPDGTVKGGFGLAVDVSERKRAEQALQASEQRFRDFAETASDWFWELDSELRFSGISGRYQEVTGQPAEDLIGRTRRELYERAGYMLSAAEAERLEANLHALDKHQPYRDFEVNWFRADGSKGAFLNSGRPVFDDAGTFKGYRGTGRDITALKNVEEELRASETRLAGMIAIAPDAIIATDENFRISIFNLGAEKTFGYQASEVLGKPLDLLIPSRFRDRHRGHVEEFRTSPENSRMMTVRGEITGLRKDGVEFPAEASISKLEHQGSQVFTVMLHDVSARQQAEAEMRTARERAEYADRAKSEFLVNMSHELRTPLNAILGFAQMIGGQVLGKDASDQYTGYAHDIRDSGEHLLAIVNDILDLSKVEAGKAELEEQDLDIGELVAATMRLVRDRASEWGLDLQIEVSSGKGKLRADARMLKQMLLNLLSNAIKFTPAGGRVLLRAGPDEDGSYRFVVIDTGVGIAPEDIPKALSQFGQVGDPKVQPGEGTGLGLPLVAALAELHGGELELESDVGVGTRATIRLPRERFIGAE